MPAKRSPVKQAKSPLPAIKTDAEILRVVAALQEELDQASEHHAAMMEAYHAFHKNWPHLDVWRKMTEAEHDEWAKGSTSLWELVLHADGRRQGVRHVLARLGWKLIDLHNGKYRITT